jgi:hypothetical protein
MSTAFTAGFAQGFSNPSTMLQAVQFIQHNRMQGEELSLRRKEADAKLKLHEAQTSLLTKKAEALSGLAKRLMGTMLEPAETSPEFQMATGEAAPPPTARPMTLGDLTPGERMQYALAIDPEAAAKTLMGGEKLTGVEPGRALYDERGQFRGFAPHAPGQSPDEMLTRSLQAFHGIVGGTQGATATAPATGPAGAPTEVPGSTTQAPAIGTTPGPRVTFVPSVTMNKDGTLSITAQGRPTNFQITTVVKGDPGTGRGVIFERTFDPTSGQVVHERPIGFQPPPAEVQRAAAVATSFGLTPGTPAHEFATGRVIAYQNLPEASREPALEALEQWASTQTSAPATGGQPTAGPGTISGAIATGRQRELDRAAERARAVKRAELEVPERPSEKQRGELAGELSLIDQLNRLTFLYKPDFVGPARGRAGGIGERVGGISGEEAEFRAADQALRNKFVKEITGAQMSEPEARRIMAQLPSPDLPEATYEARLRLTKINAKIVAIRRRQVLEASGVDVSKVPAVSLTVDEKRTVAAPIVDDYLKKRIPRDEASRLLTGLAQYADTTAAEILTTLDKGKRR